MGKNNKFKNKLFFSLFIIKIDKINEKHFRVKG